MAKLILSMDGLVLKEIPLSKERMSIGRKASNDIQIDNLAISGEHAAVVTILNDSFLEDLNSTNGTLVNGDVIELGKYKIKYVAEQVQRADAADFEKTMILRPSTLRPGSEVTAPAAATVAASATADDTQANKPMQSAPEAVTATTPPPVAAPASGAVQILSGANAGRELMLTKTLTTLGKPGVQVAVIAKRPHGYFITHVEGKQYPVLNGQPIDAQAHQLADHDVIEIAGIKMEFFLKG